MCERQGLLIQCLGLMYLPSTKLENDTPDGMMIPIFVSAMHDLDNVICVILQKGFFGTKGVVLLGMGGDLVVEVKTLLVIEQKQWKGLLADRSGETLDDLVTDVDPTTRDV